MDFYFFSPPVNQALKRASNFLVSVQGTGLYPLFSLEILVFRAKLWQSQTNTVTAHTGQLCDLQNILHDESFLCRPCQRACTLA